MFHCTKCAKHIETVAEKEKAAGVAGTQTAVTDAYAGLTAVQLFRSAQTAIELARVQILLHPRRAVNVDSLPLRPPALVASGAANVDAAWMVYMEKVEGYRQRRAAALAAWHSEGKQAPLAKHGLYPPELTWGGIEYWERVAGTAEGQCASLVVLKERAVRVPPSHLPTTST